MTPDTRDRAQPSPPPAVAVGADSPRGRSSGLANPEQWQSTPAESAARTELRRPRFTMAEGATNPPARLIPATIRPLIAHAGIDLRPVDEVEEQMNALLSPTFVDATTANAGRYEVDPTTCGLRARGETTSPNRRFGFPFPNLSAESAEAGCQIMWNVEAAVAAGGGRRAKVAVCALAGDGQDRCVQGHAASLALVGQRDASLTNERALRSASLMLLGEPSPGRSTYRAAAGGRR